ncbi:outer membrane assembly lipoprotein YfiO [Methyloceanibacter superfactus]|uniref:Outer membrane protein assembly factor BamD n=1 Tax=Methyloceanibacter superfactus TaxID=1774969 RepID=A0A1E3VW41_9HYPH|nr:outer membrane protein assembly factor BamD [Methyloceanibacter superfactus]ODR97732.1 outer membrane assembly lipoprotein YfiO [Methyloceanibacter superfactus]
MSGPGEPRIAPRLCAVLGMVLAAAMLAGCGSIFGSDKAELVNNDPPNVIYGQAEAMINKGDYGEAARQYEQVDINHPYSQEARRSIVMASYAYYKAGQYDDAVSAADRYLTLHPGTQESDLAQNIIGMSYYDQVLDPKRDQTYARRSLAAYDTLLQRYPNSRYAAEASNRVRILRDLLAANEMTIGRYYLRHNNYLAAINRFRTVVTEYQTTEQIEEALMRLTEAYMALGIVNEAQTAAAVLGHNFPDSKWYKHAYSLLGKRGLEPQQHEGSWITQTWKGDGGQT